jgi:hypothetical protein
MVRAHLHIRHQGHECFFLPFWGFIVYHIAKFVQLWWLYNFDGFFLNNFVLVRNYVLVLTRLDEVDIYVELVVIKLRRHICAVLVIFWIANLLDIITFVLALIVDYTSPFILYLLMIKLPPVFVR